MEKILRNVKKIIPLKIYSYLQPTYHYSLSLLGALFFRFPSRQIKVIGVTGTKGKSTTVEIINALLEEAGYVTAVSNTIRQKIADRSADNMFKMSLPGRFFVQGFLRKAVRAGCDYVVLEITSQAVLQYRHKFIDLDALVFTNLSPEHIESHGSYEKYRDAKLQIARGMEHSKKRPRTIVANADDVESGKFLACIAEKKITYSAKDAQPFKLDPSGIDFSLGGTSVHSPLSGMFNLYNLLGSIACVQSFGVSQEIIIRAVEKFSGVKGRVERINEGQDFTVIVDYAHTPDSLEKLYQVFEGSKNICVLGGTGGGRDSWKRKEMGRIADAYCDDIILTNEDPYDEDPEAIVKDVAEGIAPSNYTIIMDRRAAIREALSKAQTGDTVLITGKGTDPYIMGANGSKIPWNDAEVTREELVGLRRVSGI
ncbi:MAG: UDP-N-acetylmuramoyl-L-alanyl-D-glutamate--2,6-diaminopimelate ligase [Patescibacteria group bacterium]